MELTDADIERFQQLYEKRYGKPISKEMAHEQGIKLIALLLQIYKPMTEAEFDSIQQIRAETLPQMLAHFALHDTGTVAE